MTSLFMTAKLGPTAEFVAMADGEDLSPPEHHDGKSLLMAALGNADLSARYGTTQWLLDHGCRLGAPDSEGYTELHVLFGQNEHDIAEDVKIARQLIALGADVNAVSPRGGLVFNEVVMMGFSDEELKPVYDLWFEQPVLLDFETPSKRGGSPMVFAQAMPYRAVILERMERYIAEHA